MMTQDWLTDAVLYIYALSLIFFVSDAASGNRSVRKIGTGLLVFVWVIQTVYLLVILIQSFTNPELTSREYLFYVSWLLVSASFILNRWLRTEMLVLLVNVVGFGVLALNFMQVPRQHMKLSTEEVVRRLLVVHISFITLAFAVLTISALLGGMYLFLHSRLKKKRWSPVLGRMPSLEKIDLFSSRLALIGIPLFLLALSTGTVSLLIDYDPNNLLDLQVIMAYAAAVAYILYIFRSKISRDNDVMLAMWNLVAYLFLLVDFLASTISSYHQWF
ncbi:MAG: cytochrome c biogenesis protein CcsA [Candidatus Cohnella colombiensis]|uniref:Cytochrome c biogenesis protein CcsA n=1 Tax=Candidatus Cohnella colombiensis TaxID=3121368 RepID=A0AA95JCM2_9BACL|nr:MAG: cytochrome c biogenesis protein CcsA [Cohnella sp.]